MHDGRAVANFVLDFCSLEGWPVTNLALQKIIYFCHVWSLVCLGRPLVRNEFEAWEFGPVLPCVYGDFKQFGARPITSRAKRVDFETGDLVEVEDSFEEETRRFLSEVVKIYARISAASLVSLSHAEGGPWYKAWNHEGSTNPGMRIRNDEILSYYRSQGSRPTIVRQ